MDTVITAADLLTVGGIGVLVGVIIQLVKVHLPVDWTPLIAVGLGITIGLFGVVLFGQTTPQQLTDGFLRGLMAGVGAVGAFQVLKPTRFFQTVAQQKAPKNQPTDTLV